MHHFRAIVQVEQISDVDRHFGIVFQGISNRHGSGGSGLDFGEIRIGIVSGRVLAVNGGVESLSILEHLRAGEDRKRIVFIRVVGPLECDQHRGLIVIVVVATYRGDDFHMHGLQIAFHILIALRLIFCGAFCG